MVFKTKVSHFSVENTPFKDTNGKGVQKNAKFSFCGQGKFLAAKSFNDVFVTAERPLLKFIQGSQVF